MSALDSQPKGANPELTFATLQTVQDADPTPEEFALGAALVWLEGQHG